MRYGETLPAWAARQRSRRLVRHSDEKVVRWINQSQMTKDGANDSDHSDAPSRSDNVVAFSGRSFQAS